MIQASFDQLTVMADSLKVAYSVCINNGSDRNSERIPEIAIVLNMIFGKLCTSLIQIIELADDKK